VLTITANRRRLDVRRGDSYRGSSIRVAGVRRRCSWTFRTKVPRAPRRRFGESSKLESDLNGELQGDKCVINLCWLRRSSF